MMNNLVALGYGIITFAILLGVGLVVLGKFQGSVANCNTGMNYNYSEGACTNATNGSMPTETPTGAAYDGVNYMGTQLGSAGLAGWTGAIIALSVGLMFLGAFLIGKGNEGRY